MVIKSIPQSVHQKLFHCEYTETPENIIRAAKKQLEYFDIHGITDESELVDIPLPELDKPLPEWLKCEAQKIYGEFWELAEKLSLVRYPEIETGFSLFSSNIDNWFIPDPSPFKGWSKYDFKLKAWFDCQTPDKECLLFDFETFNTKREWLPFMCAALDLEGNLYSWLPDEFEQKSLPKVVDFGDKFKFGAGHNVVGYDRRYVKQAYTEYTELRLLDTLSMYYIIQGMPGTQYTLHKKLAKDDYKKPSWWYETCGGSLKALAEFYLSRKLDKDVRDSIVALEDIEELNNDTYLATVWKYCVEDVYANLGVYKRLWEQYKEFCPHIVTFAGQLERSTLQIGIDPNYHEKLKQTDYAILKVREQRNEILENAFKLSLKSNHPLLLEEFEKWREREFLLRVFKSKGCEKLAVQSELKFLTYTKKSVEKIKWESPIEDRIDFAKNYVANTPNLKIKRKGLADFEKSIYKDTDDKKLNVCPPKYISIMGKITPVFIQLKWQGEYLQHDGETWGIIKEGDFIKLPHPKGEDNVGSPLAKDYRTNVATKEFTSDIVDLQLLFDNISTVATWESFRDRFNSVYSYDNMWLPDLIPSGTITERATGLAVVMPNTKENKAGSECKTWFNSTRNNGKRLIVSADYDAQESVIGAAYDDMCRGFIGSSAASIQILAGDKDKGTDSHTSTAKLLKIDRQLGKTLNFADQFLCGLNKFATMLFIGLKGGVSLKECEQMAAKFIEVSRGDMEYGKYLNGKASAMFNKLKELAKVEVQSSIILGRKISKALQQRYIDKDFMTTRVNFNIQQTGQELVNINLVTMRILSKKYSIPLQLCYLIHDDIKILSELNHVKNTAWLLQIGHLFSKAMMYHAFGLNTIPLNQMWFSTVEVDTHLRKSIKDKSVTPSNSEPLVDGIALKAKDCIPTIAI